MTSERAVDAGEPLTDSDKLRVLAVWFDLWDQTRYEDRQRLLDDERNPGKNDVQEDLRRIADNLLILAAARGEPGLDVERLARAIPYMLHRRDESWESFATRTAEDIAANYARLATPTTPEPDQ